MCDNRYRKQETVSHAIHGMSLATRVSVPVYSHICHDMDEWSRSASIIITWSTTEPLLLWIATYFVLIPSEEKPSSWQISLAAVC